MPGGLVAPPPPKESQKTHLTLAAALLLPHLPALHSTSLLTAAQRSHTCPHPRPNHGFTQPR